MVDFAKLPVLAALAIAVPLSAHAQAGTDDAGTPADPVAAKTAQVEAQAKLVAQYADLAKQQAELAKQEAERIKAIGLPSFEGKTELKGDAGKLEAMQLTVPAVMLAGSMIAGDARAAAASYSASLSNEQAGKLLPIVLVTGSEKLDFGLIYAIQTEASSLKAGLEDFGDAIARENTRLTRGSRPSVQGGGPKPAFVGTLLTLAPAIGSAVSAVAGLLRTETTVDAVTLDQIDDAMLAAAVARYLPQQVVLPSAAILPDATETPLTKELGSLVSGAQWLGTVKTELAATNKGKPDKPSLALIAKIDAWLGSFSEFYGRIRKADANGVVPLVEALRLDAVRAGTSYVLRVRVNKGAGSLISYKNIGTFFGADPIRVSGGLTASYTLTSPKLGLVLDSGVLNCRTALARLRDVQRGIARDNAGPPASAEIVDGPGVRCEKQGRPPNQAQNAQVQGEQAGLSGVRVANGRR